MREMLAAIDRAGRLSAARRGELRSAVKFVRRIGTSFDRLGLMSLGGADRVAHDLAEIHEVLALCSARLEKIVTQRSLDPALTRRLLLDIQSALYIHLPYHQRLLKRPLQKLIDVLEPQGAGVERRARKLTTVRRRSSQSF
ncbi:MAG TPA: hypothetical protein VI485_26120 [Vicinamibacterales bacterium]|nr:hypothetical protein [Vicinamibacterales bacterium]